MGGGCCQVARSVFLSTLYRRGQLGPWRARRLPRTLLPFGVSYPIRVHSRLGQTPAGNQPQRRHPRGVLISTYSSSSTRPRKNRVERTTVAATAPNSPRIIVSRINLFTVPLCFESINSEVFPNCCHRVNQRAVAELGPPCPLFPRVSD